MRSGSFLAPRSSDGPSFRKLLLSPEDPQHEAASRHWCWGWALTQYDTVRAALLEAATFSSASGCMMNEPMNAATQGIMLCSDDPDHPAMRRLFARPLQPKALVALRPRSEALAAAKVDALLSVGTFDAVRDLAHFLPLAVVNELVVSTKTATGFQMFLLRSMLDPEWGTFIAHIGLLSGDTLFTRKIRKDIQLGVETGDYVVASVELASDLEMGAKIEAILRMIAGGGSVAYVQGMAMLVLRAFGVAPVKAEKTVHRAFDRLVSEAPGKVLWWRQLEDA